MDRNATTPCTLGSPACHGVHPGRSHDYYAQHAVAERPVTIRLYRTPDGWMARSESYRAVFGTDLIPTAFTFKASAARVLAEITERNPDATVLVAGVARYDVEG